MDNNRLPRKLTAVLYADVAGYSRLTGEDEEGTHRRLSAYLDRFAEAIGAHDGRVVHYAGDAVLADFVTVTDALACAVAVQAALRVENDALPVERRVEFRIGVNLGEVIVDRGDIYGDGVNVAARLEALAEPGGICVSEAARTAAGRKLAVGYEFLGEREVKNIPEPVRAYRVAPQAAAGSEPYAPPPCPYPGMVPFESEDAARFHGRGREIEQMVGLLRHHRFIMVIGPSGSGKSSLVQAGMLPAITRSPYFEHDYWLVRRMRPGPEPAVALARVFDVEPSADGLDLDVVDRLLGQKPPAGRVLLLVDQFEETFTQATREEAGRFIGALQGLRTRQNIALLLTLRADFYPDLMNSYLWPVDASQRVEVAPLRGEALREAIVRPAEEVGVHIEDGLIDRLLADAADEPGVLPLLQETMRLLWHELSGRVLPLAAYERLSRGSAAYTGRGISSGLAAAIAMKADATLVELGEAEQAIARRTFLRLVQFGEGRADTRRQQPLVALRSADDDPALFERTLEHLTDNRLLTRAGADEHEGAVVDIAHESLITGWGRLREWAERRREAEQSRRRLEAKAAEWVRLGSGSGGLLDEAELPEAERWLGSSDAADLGCDAALPGLVRSSQRAIEEAQRASNATREKELRQAEELAEEQRHRIAVQRRAMVGLAAVFVIAIGAAVFAWLQEQKVQGLAEQEAIARQDAEARRQEAERLRMASIAQLLLTRAPQQKEIGEDERSVLLARQGYLLAAQRRGRLRDQADRVLRTLVSTPHFSVNLIQSSLAAGSYYSVAFSPDGTMLAASSVFGKGEVLLWDLSRRGSLPTLLQKPSEADVRSLAFSSDGRTLVGGDLDGNVLRWKLDRPGASPLVLDGHEGGVGSVALGPDGRFLAAGGKRSETVLLWDLADPSAAPALMRADLPDPSGGVAETRTAAVDAGARVSVAFSPDGKTLAAGSLSGVLRLWDPGDPNAPITVLRGHQGWTSLAFSPDGKTLASGGRDATVRLWKLRDPGAQAVVLRGHKQPVQAVAFSPDGETLVSASSDDTARLWAVNGPKPATIAVLKQPADWNGVAFSPDGKQLASTNLNADKSLRLWQMTPSGQPVVLGTKDHAAADGIAFSPDGKTMAVAQDRDGVRLWDLTDLAAPATVLRGFEWNPWAVTISPDGRTLAVAGQGATTVQLWRLGDHIVEAAALRRRAANEVWSTEFSPDGRTLAATGDFGVLDLWDPEVPAAESVAVKLATQGWIREVAFSPDGRALAVGVVDGTLHLGDARNPGSPWKVLRANESSIRSVAFSPNSNTLASGGGDNAVRLWNLRDLSAPPIVLGYHESPVERVRFSPDGKRLASGSKDKSVRLWDAVDPSAPPALLYGHEDTIWTVEFSPDGRTLASGSADGTVRLWDLTHPVLQLTTQGLADLVCKQVWRNLRLDEWQQFVGEDIPYERTCPNLPIHPSVVETADSKAKAGDTEGAVALFRRAVELQPDLGIEPEAEAARLAGNVQ